MYKKRYNLKATVEIINKQIERGRKYMDFEDLLIEIGFDILDINEFYIRNVRHHFRYEREKES